MLKKRKKRQNKQGAFTFVEVLAAVSIVALVMTAMGSMMALSVRVAEANEMEQLAQMKAQQSIEFFRRERLVRGWTAFNTKLEDGKTYCLSDIPTAIGGLSTKPLSGCPKKIDFNFFRYSIEAKISNTISPQESITVTINIDRFDLANNKIIKNPSEPNEPFYTVEQTFKKY